MIKLSENVIHFFRNQEVTIVSTIDKDGFPHNSCKGLIKITKDGKVYLLDAYLHRTFENLTRNPNISIAAFDEHRFSGFCLKGKGYILSKDKLDSVIIKAWEERITSRLTKRLLKNLHEEKGHPSHPEVLLPRPEYMIVVEVDEVVDLTPQHMK